MESLGFKHSDIILLGYSIGSAVAGDVAGWMGQNPPLATILIAPFYSMGECISTLPGPSGRCYDWWIDDNEHFVTGNSVALIRSPLLILHGKNDQLVPVNHSRKLKERYDKELMEQGYFKLFESEVMDHFVGKEFERDVIEPIKEWFYKEKPDFEPKNIKIS